MAHVPFATFHMSYEGTLVAVDLSAHYIHLANRVVCSTLVTSLSMLEFVLPTGKCPIAMDTNSLRILLGVVSSHDVEQRDFTR